MTDRIYQQIEKSMIDSSVSSENPIAFFIGGQPGSNKKKITHQVSQLMGVKNYVRINISAFRDHHPDFSSLCRHFNRAKAKEIDEVCFSWSEKLLETAAWQQRNIFFETDMHDKYWITGKIQEMYFNYGYRIYVAAIAMPEKMSRLEILKRCAYRGDLSGWISTEVHDRAYHLLPEALYQIEKQGYVKDIFIYDKNSKIVWRSSENPPSFVFNDARRSSGQGKLEVSPRSKLQLAKERARTISEAEKRELISDIETLLYYMKTHHAASDDIAEAEQILSFFTERRDKKRGFLNILF